MDVNQSQLLEIGLNAIGYLAGGGIMLILASMLKRQKVEFAPATARATTPVNTEAVEMIEQQERISSEKKQNKNFQFINLSAEPISNNQVSEQPPAASGRRNRTEVYDMARKMLSDKKSNEEISSRLPLSEAELSLLRVRSNQDKGAQNGQR